MPTIEVSKTDLEKLVGKKFSVSQLESMLEYAKSEIDSQEGGILKIDVKDSNRPDLWSTVGIAREIRGQIGKEKGITIPKIKKGKRKVKVDSKLAKIRPAAAYAIVRNVKMNEDVLKQIIQLQEKICMTFGRKRKEVAIGIFDLENVQGDCKYFAAKKNLKFTPLGFREDFTLGEILDMHPKGKEYGGLLDKMKFYPLLVDSRDEVLSMPPIINSETSGKVASSSKNLFIDVTGYNQTLVEQALEIVCLALNARGGKIETVTVNHPRKKIVTPSFKDQSIILPKELFEKISGFALKETEISKLLSKRHMKLEKKKGKLLVKYPSYRADILHPADIVEELLISYGYNSIEIVEPELAVIGSLLEESKITDRAREAGIGLGLQEVLTFTLSSKEKQSIKIAEDDRKLVEIGNPMSSEWSVFRQDLYPELLEFLSKNGHREFPHKIFEVGRVVVSDSKKETGVREELRFAFLYSGKNASYNLAKSVLDELSRLLGIKPKIEGIAKPGFEPGKSQSLKVNGRNGNIGEITFSTLDAFSIKEKTCGFEITLFEN